ncbi:MAG TPA: ABC transporter permease [Gemmatimonadaceae bacterium]|nr:ABC transporter permease [Gemmatimonadaceae bacterium]
MRAYRLLLRLLPASFRLEYGDEMTAVFSERRREATGTLSTLTLWAETIEDIVRNALAAHWDILRQDLQYAVRALARTPGFTATAILVTGLGIGANAAAFSVADFVLIRPLPYLEADRLVKLSEQTPGGNTNVVSPAVYRDWRASSSVFQSMAAYYSTGVNLVGQSEPQHLQQSVVTASLFPTLGVRPLRGRVFTAEDERAGGTIILSYALWQSAFGGDEAIIGKRLVTNGVPREVVGVMPADFHFPRREIAIWTPIGVEEQSQEDRTNTYWEAVARLRPGVTLEQARAQMDALSRQLSQQFPRELEGVSAWVIRLRDQFSPQSRALLLALCAAAACVLLIACANLANLLLARALTRHQEVVVRVALGAGRERLVRQSITESLLLALLGGVLGIGIAVASLPLLTRLIPTSLPIAQSPVVDLRIVLFAAVLSTLTGVAFGAWPAWQSSGTHDLGVANAGARAVGGRRAHARAVLVATEIMASVVLLISAGLLLHALVRVQDVDPGFRATNVMALRTALPSPNYDSLPRRAAFYRDVLTEVRGMPGVAGAAYISGLPMASQGGVWPVAPEGEGEVGPTSPVAISRYVTPGFFATLQIPIRRGRDIGDADETNQPWVAVVSESFVQRYWPNEDPIGKRFTFLTDMRTVVGVVGDVRVRGLERHSEPQVYLSYKQVAEQASPFFYPRELVIRSSSSPGSLIPTVRRIVRRVDPEQPVSDIRSMTEIVSDVTAARAVQVRVLGGFAALAFLLAAIGIHGLLSFSVSSRQREIGVRMALGAQGREVVRMVVRQAVVLAGAGIAPGLVLAYLAGRAMESLLFGVRPNDLVTFTAVAVLCVVMTVIGCLAPALRAVRVDPAIALRAEA